LIRKFLLIINETLFPGRKVEEISSSPTGVFLGLRNSY